jgi:exodeoxyribonuclease VII large subunit
VTEKEFYRISEISATIEGAIASAFPRMVWVVGEIQGLDRNRHRGHWYFELCETDEGGDTVRLAATIWKGVQTKIFSPGGKCAGVFDLSGPLDGSKILALCRVDFYPPYGKISLHIQDIDPEYTLGELEARRKALVEKLKREDALERNRRTSLPDVPLRIGVITSDNSAACNDFMKELTDSGFAFRVFFCDARMQGDDALTTIPAAFRTLEALEPDLIVLVRGGGSRLDLSWFDREEIVYAVVNSSRPVVTGIGHEIDLTLSEMTAHTGKKTPTAAAAFLVDRVRHFLESVLETGHTIARAARVLSESEEEKIADRANRIRVSCRRATVDDRFVLQNLGRDISAVLSHRIGSEAESVNRLTNRLLTARQIDGLVDLRVDLGRLQGRVCDAAERRTEREGQVLKLCEEKRRLLDPINVVKRGYALVRGKGGRIVKETAALSVGDPVTIVMRDGKLGVHINKIDQEVTDGEEEACQLEIW